jgi:hypothetical protein
MDEKIQSCTTRMSITVHLKYPFYAPPACLRQNELYERNIQFTVTYVMSMTRSTVEMEFQYVPPMCLYHNELHGKIIQFVYYKHIYESNV